MEKPKKVLSVISGFLSKYELEELTIILDDENRVAFSGHIENFLHPDEALQNESYRLKHSLIKRFILFNKKKLFIFI